MKIRASKLVLAVLALLLVAAPLATSMWHHHAGSSDTNCPVCHFNHQPMDRPTDGLRISPTELVTFRSAPSEERFISNRDILPLPSRAPPTA